MRTYKKLIILLDTGNIFNSALLTSIFAQCQSADVILISKNKTSTLFNTIASYQVTGHVDFIDEKEASDSDTLCEMLKHAEYAIKRKYAFDISLYHEIIVCGPNATHVNMSKNGFEHVVMSGTVNDVDSLYLQFSDMIVFFYVAKLMHYRDAIKDQNLDKLLDRLLFRADIPLFRK
jgi:uncharacterized protein YsxB (DUF464 family)